MLVYWFTTKDTREVKFSSMLDARTFILIFGWGNVKIQKNSNCFQSATVASYNSIII